jgi:transposase
MTETESKWSERVREWRASGKTAEEFAEGRGFKGSTLRFWASTLRRSESGTARTRKPQVRLVRVVARPAAAGASLDVAVGAARVTVRPGFDAALLRQLVEALGGAS